MTEIWKDIIGFNYYQISNTGLIRSLDRLCNGWNSKKIKKGRILKQRIGTNGYLEIGLTTPEGKRLTLTVHRLIAIAFIPNPENKPTVNHINGVKTNNNVSNLEWASYSENLKHAYKNGLNKHKDFKGANHPRFIDGLTMKGEYDKVCEWCKNNFIGKLPVSRFCSRSCAGKWIQRPKKCYEN